MKLLSDWEAMAIAAASPVKRLARRRIRQTAQLRPIPRRNYPKSDRLIKLADNYRPKVSQ